MGNSNGNENDGKGDGESNEERVEDTMASKVVVGNVVVLSTPEKVKLNASDGIGMIDDVLVSCLVLDTTMGVTIDDMLVNGNSTELESSGKKEDNTSASDSVAVTWDRETRLFPPDEDNKILEVGVGRMEVD